MKKGEIKQYNLKKCAVCGGSYKEYELKTLKKIPTINLEEIIDNQKFVDWKNLVDILEFIFKSELKGNTNSTLLKFLIFNIIKTSAKGGVRGITNYSVKK